MNTRELFEKMDHQHVLIVGDVMIDRYLTGSVSRISPEAPVPVVLQQSTHDRLGGAANVALNVRAMGGIALLCGVVGDDADGHSLMQSLLVQNQLKAEGIIISGSRRTTVKTRILGNNQQMLRIDQEDTHDLDAAESRELLSRVDALIRRYPVQAMILQDYNKGVLTAPVIRRLIELAASARIFTAVDPKKHNFFDYQGVDLFKPNLKEIRESAPFPVDANLESLEKAAVFLEQKLKNSYTMLTLSEKGLYLKGKAAGRLYATQARNVADVSGAGDTVISVATMALAAGLDLDTVATLSNLAGGQVCESPGVVPVNRALLQEELDTFR